MKSDLHLANSRGHADHGWLKSYHTFSFAGYYDPNRMGFGALRVLNDDNVAPGSGFATHPHQNMEIISIPLSGDLEHKDDMGNVAVIKEGDIQVMSAGTGVYHSEKNKNSDKAVQFLQIWIVPKENGVKPRYDQISIKDISINNSLQQILSPNEDGQGVWIHQDAWFYRGNFDKDLTIEHALNMEGNGFYLFVLEGGLKVGEHELKRRDAIALWETRKISLDIRKGTDLLLIEVPV